MKIVTWNIRLVTQLHHSQSNPCAGFRFLKVQLFRRAHDALDWTIEFSPTLT